MKTTLAKVNESNCLNLCMYAGFCNRILYNILVLNIVNNSIMIQLYFMTTVLPDTNAIYISYMYMHTYVYTYVYDICMYIL